MSDQSETLRRIEQLRGVGVRVNGDYEYRGEVGEGRYRVELPGTVDSLVLPFSPSEWCAMCMRELPDESDADSLYIGPCCGNTGLVQDVINGVFRDGGLIDVDALAEIGPLLRGHDGWEPFSGDFDVDAALEPSRWAGEARNSFDGDRTALPETLDPWDKICVIHAALESILSLPRSERPDRAVHPAVEADHPGTTVMSRVERALQTVSWGDMFAPAVSGDSFERGSDESRTRALDERGTHELVRRVELMRLVQPARDLATFVEGLLADEEPLEGVALVRLGTDEVLETRRGLCVYADREAAERVMELWGRVETVESSRATHGAGIHVPEFVDPSGLAEVVPISVTVADGLVVRR